MPGRRSRTIAAGQRRCALDHVDHDLRLEVNEAGRVDGGVVPVGPQERGLINAEVGVGPDPVGVIDQRGAVLEDRVHHRPPAHTQLLGHSRQRSRVLTDLTARLRACSAGKHDLRVDVFRVLGPGLGRAVRVGTAPPPLAPHEPHRPPEARQITQRPACAHARPPGLRTRCSPSPPQSSRSSQPARRAPRPPPGPGTRSSPNSFSASTVAHGESPRRCCFRQL